MSYILDALRRAESERERGKLPGLHSSPELPSPPTSRRPPPPWVWAAAGAAGLVAAAAAVWLWLGPAPATQAVVASAVPVAAEPPPAPQPPPLAPVTTTATPLAVPITAPTAAPAPPADGPTAAQIRAGQSVAGAKEAPTAPAAKAVVEDLPPALLPDLPKIVISGSVYSDDRASRFLIVHGEVVHEGDTVAPGVTIEQIRPKEAWLKFRGYRVKLPL